MKRYTRPSGFSLVEVTIVLAISVVMVGVIASIYSQRSRVAGDDATNQIISQFQAVYNEAKQGNGPNNTDAFLPGETIFGQAVEFRNNCGSAKPCLRVYMLKMSAVAPGGDAKISAYDYYDRATPQGFSFNLNNASVDCSSLFVTCYGTEANNLQSLNQPPVSAAGLVGGFMIVIRNSSGQMYAFAKTSDEICAFQNSCTREGELASIGPQATKLSSYVPARSGKVRLATGKPANNDYNSQGNWDGADPKYYVSLDLSNISNITVSQP